MARRRLTMRKIKEVIRLKYESELSNRAIASACKISNSTVGDYLKRAKIAGIRWPLGPNLVYDPEMVFYMNY